MKPELLQALSERWPPPAPRISAAPKADMGDKAKAAMEKPVAKPAHPLAFLIPLAVAA